MGLQERGLPTPEGQSGRVRLSVRDPLVESLLCGLDYEGQNLDELRAFCKAACRARNGWSIRSRSGLLGSSGRIGRHDAERALTQELAKLAKAGAQ